MGCPVNKIVKNEAGAMWLKDPDTDLLYHQQGPMSFIIPIYCQDAYRWADPSLAVVENASQGSSRCFCPPCTLRFGRTRADVYRSRRPWRPLHKVAQAWTTFHSSPTVTSGYVYRSQTTHRRSRC